MSPNIGSQVRFNEVPNPSGAVDPFDPSNPLNSGGIPTTFPSFTTPTANNSNTVWTGGPPAPGYPGGYPVPGTPQPSWRSNAGSLPEFGGVPDNARSSSPSFLSRVLPGIAMLLGRLAGQNPNQPANQQLSPSDAHYGNPNYIGLGTPTADPLAPLLSYIQGTANNYGGSSPLQATQALRNSNITLPGTQNYSNPQANDPNYFRNTFSGFITPNASIGGGRAGGGSGSSGRSAGFLVQ